MRSHAPKPRTRQALWNIKNERPELFPELNAGQQQKLPERESDRLAGFEPCDTEGWLHHKERNTFLEQATRRLCWFDAVAGIFRDLAQGEALGLAFVGGAATQIGQGKSIEGDKSFCAGGVVKLQQVPKHVVIPDLHRAAQALKMDISHVDRPAAMVAVFGASPEGVASVPVDVAARMCHEKLIRRLAAFRSEWPSEALCDTMSATMDDIAVGHAGALPVAAVALVVGHRIVAAATSGARFSIVVKVEEEGGTVHLPSAAAAPSPDMPMTSTCRELAPGPEAALFVTLVVGELRLVDAELVVAAVPHLSQGRPRAGSVSVLKDARERGATGHLAVACARLGLNREAIAAAGCSEPPSKRHKVEAKASKVRVRHILLRHWRGVGAKPIDPIRKGIVSRTLEEAELQLLSVLDGLVADKCVGFSAACKAMSECQSALKGGELIGDLGWLDRGMEDQQGKGGKASGPAPAIRSQVPASVRRAAFELEVGELSDLVCSEIGVHLLLRTA